MVWWRRIGIKNQWSRGLLLSVRASWDFIKPVRNWFKNSNSWNNFHRYWARESKKPLQDFPLKLTFENGLHVKSAFPEWGPFSNRVVSWEILALHVIQSAFKSPLIHRFLIRIQKDIGPIVLSGSKANCFQSRLFYSFRCSVQKEAKYDGHILFIQ